MKNLTRGALLALPITTFALPSFAQECVLVTAMLVFWMNAGFALVESGLCRAKNTSNILAKNFIVFAASSISFYAIGWGLMVGDGNPFIGTQGLFFVCARSRAREGLM